MAHHAPTPGCFAGLRSLFSSRNCHNSESSRPARPSQTLTDPQSQSRTTEHNVCCTVPCSFSTDAQEYQYCMDMGAAVSSTEEPGGPPPPYGNISTGHTHTPIYRPEVMKTIEAEIASLDGELRVLSLKIHDHPETAFHEFYAHDTLTDFMRAHGFTITPHLAGLQSAWRAEWSFGEGGRTLGVNSEMDALPGIGHACGHNLIAISGVGIALGVKAAMEAHQIPGKVVLLGTPAEEGGGGKVLLLEKGAYEDMDVCLMCHPSTGSKNSVGLGGTLAIQPLVVEYFGHTAHAAIAPWEGQNALDAAVLAYSSVSMLRQQIRPDCRVHGIIEGRNWAANVIPDYAKMQWIVRAPSYIELNGLLKRVRACIEAAALAASCRIEVSEGVPYYDLRQNPVLEQEFLGTVKERYGMRSPAPHTGSSASTDFGNVTYALPAIHPSFAIPTVPNGGNHTAEFTQAARTPEAHAAALSVAKGLALVGVRVLDDDVFFVKARESYEEMVKASGGPVGALDREY